jgi:SagB-type dehydrogenase family enzyme
MTPNGDTRATWAYHDATKHSVISVRESAHVLDMTNQPRPWKLYKDDLSEVGLGGELPSSGVSALDSLNVRPAAPAHNDLTLERIAALLLLSAGVTKQLTVPGGAMHFRAAACTGALYHIELYVIAGEVSGLPAGVYHFGVHDHTLRRIREGDFRGVVARATADQPAVKQAQAVIAYTTTYWRNAWKYQDRAYRHAYWDSGTIIANTLAAASAHGVDASVVAGFVDEQINRLLGVGPNGEVTVALVPLGRSTKRTIAMRDFAPVTLETESLSGREIDFPSIGAMHAASALGTDDDVAAWRHRGTPMPANATGDLFPLAAEDGSARPPLDWGRSLEEVIMRRGSSRRFERSPLTWDETSTMLGAALQKVPLDATSIDVNALTDVYVIANEVDGLPPGTYRYRRSDHALEHLYSADTRDSSTHLALDQPLGGDAALDIYFLADLTVLLDQLGNRAYRAALLDASIAAGRLYLAAYAMSLGATGLTFYDDEVTDYFSPSAAGKSVMFLIAIGRPAKRRWPH